MHSNAPNGGNAESPFIVVGDFVYDPVRRRMSKNGTTVEITGKPLEALCFLLQNHDRVITKSELRLEVWRTHVGDNTIEQAISKIRAALGEKSQHFIQTIHGQGYRFTPAIQEPEALEQPVTERVGPAGGSPEDVDSREDETEAALPATRLSRRRWAVGIAAGLVAGSAGGSWLLRKTPEVQTAEIDENRVTARDSTGEVIWRVSFAGKARLGEPWSRRAVVADAVVNGQRRVLVATAFAEPTSEREQAQDELICLSNEGRILWRYRTFPDLRDPAGLPFGEGWAIRDLLVTREDGHDVAWLAVTSHRRWASCVVRVDHHGFPVCAVPE
jgi:DNA-binding winged helix-turn-helix (wHTH) protein